MGVAGPVALGQLYCNQGDALWRGQNRPTPNTSLVDIQRQVQGAILQDAQRQIQQATMVKPLVGDAAFNNMANSQSLLAVPA